MSPDDPLRQALAIRVAVAAAVLTALKAYVVVVAGFASFSWFVIVSAVFAAVVAAVDELAGGFFH